MSKELLYIGQPGNSNTTVVAASSSTRTIDAAWVCNATAGAVTLSVHLVPSGDSVADDVALYDAVSVAAGATVQLAALVNQCIPRAATLSMVASAAASLTVTISGRTV